MPASLLANNTNNNNSNNSHTNNNNNNHNNNNNNNHTNNNNKPATAPAAAPATTAEAVFDLPANVPEEDVLILQNILTGLQSLGLDSVHLRPICTRYKVDLTSTGYLLKAMLPMADLYQLTMEDMLFMHSICPARIESMAVGRSVPGSTATELWVRILDHKQRLMVTSTVSFFSAVRARKFQRTMA